jgi:hypothetical protein
MNTKIKSMQLLKLFLIFFLYLLPAILYGQTAKKCCDISSCREKAEEFAVRVTGITTFLGNCSDDQEANETTLSNFKSSHPDLYQQLILTVKELQKYFFADKPEYSDPDCFSNALPGINKSNVMRWVNHVRFHILKVKPVFPSTEFCGGWKKRFELGQGAAAFLNKTKMAYLGSLRGYLMYTIPGKEKCGGRLRIGAGPAFFLRSSNSYITLSSRLAVRLTDLRAEVFSLGNLNLFGGYNTNFDGFNYAEAGLEAELGPFGFNFSGNYNIDNKKPGFLIGIIFGNKKL